jgi:hypothetical protein
VGVDENDDEREAVGVVLTVLKNRASDHNNRVGMFCHPPMMALDQ